MCWSSSIPISSTSGSRPSSSSAAGSWAMRRVGTPGDPSPSVRGPGPEPNCCVDACDGSASIPMRKLRHPLRHRRRRRLPVTSRTGRDRRRGQDKVACRPNLATSGRTSTSAAGPGPSRHRFTCAVAGGCWGTTAAGRQEASMAAEPLSRFPAARTSDCDEAQAAMAATFLPLRMRMLERPGDGGVDMRLNALRVADVTVPTPASVAPWRSPRPRPTTTTWTCRSPARPASAPAGRRAWRARRAARRCSCLGSPPPFTGAAAARSSA
jgi:hypothetical protein